MAGETILIVDDENEINDLIRSYLVKESFVPVSAFNGKQAMEMLREHKPQFIILDVMLPDIEGTDLCLEIRKESDAPILFLSCKSEEIDKIIALSAGGDDYMTKPFLSGELIARVKAHLRRVRTISRETQEEDEIHEFSGLMVNMTTREVKVDGSFVNLTAKEFDILKVFIKNPRRIFTTEQMFEAAWKTSSLEGDARTVMVYISTLRKKLEYNPQNPKYIISIRGVGYKFNHNLL